MTRKNDKKTGATLCIGNSLFEQSPYIHCYADSVIEFGVYAGRFYPKATNESTIEKYWALRRRAALYDVPEKPIQIEGPDAVPFLERVFARKVGDLKEGRGRYAIACTARGGVFMDGLLFKLAEGKYWYVQADGDLVTWLTAHCEGFDVEISDPKSRVLQIQGPNAMEVMREASNGGIDESMGYFHAGFHSLGGQVLYVSRTGWTGELGFEIYSDGGNTDHGQLWNHLVESGTPHGMAPGCDVSSMTIRRIEAGILDNGADMDMTTTPFQVGLGAFIDLDQEQFVGRASLLEADRRSVLYGLKCSAATPEKNSRVLNGDRIVGRVTAGAWSPFLASGIGYVRFIEPGEWEGKSLEIETVPGKPVPCEIVPLPFYDPEKRIARGLDTTIPQQR